MLNFNEAKQVGINACIDKLGREFVMRHRDCSTSACGWNGDDVFCFVGVDTENISDNRDGVLILDSKRQFPFRASCNVKLSDGTPEFLDCVVPN